MRVLGLMSGTSMDGVDAAVLQTNGARILGFGESAFIPYAPQEQAILRASLGQWPGPQLHQAAAIVQQTHRAAIAQFQDIDLIGFHGQTLAHDPANGRSHQLGDGATLAPAHKVVWDFRSADMRAGGQGAPLIPLFHHALARWLGLRRVTVFLNLGGVANVTVVDPNLDDTAPGAVIAFDTGPASALIDDLMMVRRGLPCDHDGQLAATGAVDHARIQAALRAPWFAAPPPKSADRNQFHAIFNAVSGCTDADAAATLTAFSAACLGKAPVPRDVDWLVMGGGRHNQTLMAMIAAEIGTMPIPIDAFDINGDMIEAQGFAYLAARVLHNLPTSLPSTTGCKHPVSGGKISPPSSFVP